MFEHSNNEHGSFETAISTIKSVLTPQYWQQLLSKFLVQNTVVMLIAEVALNAQMNEFNTIPFAHKKWAVVHLTQYLITESELSDYIML